LKYLFFTLALFLAGFPLSEPVAKTWLFGAAACPKWKAIPDKPALSQRMSAACEKDIRLFVSGFQSLYKVPESNIITLLNEEATGDKVRKSLAALAARIKAEDRVILYVNIHGGKLDTLYHGYPAKDEVFAWYTEKRPVDPVKAVQDGRWMSVRQLRDLVNDIVAKEIVVIIEACHAGEGLADFADNVHDGVGGRGEDWNGREAVIVSSGNDQIANFTKHGDEALFTKKMSQALKSGKGKSLLERFETARIDTHRTARKNCEAKNTHKELLEDWSNFKLLCTQMPTSYDPFGLLDDMHPDEDG